MLVHVKLDILKFKFNSVSLVPRTAQSVKAFCALDIMLKESQCFLLGYKLDDSGRRQRRGGDSDASGKRLARLDQNA